MERPPKWAWWHRAPKKFRRRECRQDKGTSIDFPNPLPGQDWWGNTRNGCPTLLFFGWWNLPLKIPFLLHQCWWLFIEWKYCSKNCKIIKSHEEKSETHQKCVVPTVFAVSSLVSFFKIGCHLTAMFNDQYLSRGIFSVLRFTYGFTSGLRQVYVSYVIRCVCAKLEFLMMSLI